jgi:hypothetical protein
MAQEEVHRNNVQDLHGHGLAPKFTPLQAHPFTALVQKLVVHIHLLDALLALGRRRGA